MLAIRVALFVSMLTLGVAACGSGDGSPAASGSRGAASGPAGTEVLATPTVEGSGPESPQQPQDGGPVITNASLPIGGSTDPGTEPTEQCADLAILASPPAGVTVHVTQVKFDPEGVFELGGSACPSDRTPCSFPAEITAESQSTCSVSVAEVSGARGHTSVTLAADVHCDTQDACDDYRSTLGATPNQKVLDATSSGEEDDDSGSAPVSDSPAPGGS